MSNFDPHDYLPPGQPDRRIRNKDYAPNSSYHVYNRGLNGQSIFLDDVDRHAFLTYFSRLLTAEETRDHRGRSVVSMQGEVAVIAYALMSNHYHLVVHQFESDLAVRTLIGRAMSAYVMYFKRRANCALPSLTSTSTRARRLATRGLATRSTCLARKRAKTLGVVQNWDCGRSAHAGIT